MIRKTLLDAALGTGIGRAVGHAIYNTYGRTRSRSQSLSTSFFRNIAQLRALEGPLADIPARGRIRILNAASSTGCEAFSLGGYLADQFPDLDWSIDALDISPEAVAMANAAVYPASGLPAAMDDDLARVRDLLFIRSGAELGVNPAIRQRIRFAEGDALSAEMAAGGPYDIVLGQNFMIHMDPDRAASAFANLVSAMRDDGALFVHGVDLDLKQNLVARHGLAPVDWRIAEIHDEDHVRRNAWPFYYWGLEPLDRAHRQFATRYASIYRKAL
jgi:chemotaxis protein methyltransferase CheR